MKSKNGFTLIEILAVLSVLALVAILIMPAFLSAFSGARSTLRKFDKDALIDAGRMYLTDLDTGDKEYIYDENVALNDLNGHNYKKGDRLTMYDFRTYVIRRDGINVNAKTLVNEGYYDKRCKYKGEIVDGKPLEKDQNCHVPENCTLHLKIDYDMDNGYYVTKGYTVEIKSGCEK